MTKKRKKSRFNAKVAAVLIASAVVVAAALIAKSAFAKKKLSGNVVGYLPYYSTAYLDKIDFSALTHLNIAFTNPDSSGNLSNNISDSTMKKIVSTCHKHSVKAIASFGGGAISSKNYNTIMQNNPDGIKSFNKKIIEYCKKYDLDGVDIDFEFIASSPAWSYFEEWITQLKTECDNNDLILSAAVASWYADNISDKAMKSFDYILVMAYDNDADSKNHSTYAYAQQELNYYESTRGIKKNKLILGVPFYGYSYTSGGSMNWNSGASYRYILSKNSSASKGDYSGAYAYNGPDTIRKKAELSKDYGGIMIWELSQDAGGSDSLLKVIKDVY